MNELDWEYLEDHIRETALLCSRTRNNPYHTDLYEYGKFEIDSQNGVSVWFNNTQRKHIQARLKFPLDYLFRSIESIRKIERKKK